MANEDDDAKGDGSNGSNGTAHHPLDLEPRPLLTVTPAPPAVRDLADACVRFVQKALGVPLDFTPETLPILDHYLREARRDASQKPAALILVAHAAGAYLGEVVRRRHASWWRTDGDDPGIWRIELEAVYLSFSPMQLVADVLARTASSKPGAPERVRRPPPGRLRAPAPLPAITGVALSDEEPHEGDADAEAALRDDNERLELEEEDRQAVAERLGELPPVDEDEFFAPSTRVEVIDIAVEAIRARRLAAGEGDSVLGPDDYER